MDFFLNPPRPLQGEIQRVVLELIADAQEQLRREEAEIHHGIHDARKDFKKIRAVLRLVRLPLGESFEIENQSFRDLGRALSSTRDSEAMIEAFDSLMEEDGTELRPDLAHRTREYLVSRRDERTATASNFDETRSNISSELERASERTRRWEMDGEGFSLLENGLRRGYRAARRTGREALVDPSAASIHEWRKHNKIHWYHIRLLAGVWAGEGNAWRAGLDRLNDILGHHQDLELLIELADSGIPHYTRFESDHLRQLLRRRQDRLRDEAALRGAPYLAEKPGALTARIRTAWQRASDEF